MLYLINRGDDPAYFSSRWGFLKGDMDLIFKTIKENIWCNKNYGLSTLRGFTITPNWLLKSQNYNRNEKAVIIALASFAMSKNECWPSIKKISTRSGLGLTATKKYLKSITEKGLIERVWDGKHKSKLSKINFGRQTTRY